METKKVESKRIERYRGTFLLIGFAVALSGTLVAFEWKTYDKPQYHGMNGNIFGMDVQIQPTMPDKPEVKKMKQMFLTNIKLVDHGEDPDIFFFDINSYTGNLDSLTEIQEVSEIETVFEPTIPFPEIAPEFPGGEVSLFAFIKGNLVYPEIAKANGDQGIVYTSFYINSKGAVMDIAIERGVSEALDKEAIRVIKMMPRWKPAQQGITLVKTKISLPIHFKLM